MENVSKTGSISRSTKLLALAFLLSAGLTGMPVAKAVDWTGAVEINDTQSVTDQKKPLSVSMESVKSMLAVR